MQTNGKEQRCLNCGQTGLTGANCPKPKVTIKDRPCFKCGKRGHVSSQCKPGGSAKMLADEDNVEGEDAHLPEYVLPLFDGEGFNEDEFHDLAIHQESSTHPHFLNTFTEFIE